MAPTDTSYLPMVETTEPVGDPALRASHEIAALAAGLLLSSGSPLLAIAIPSDGWGDRIPILVWNNRLRPDLGDSLALWKTAMFAPVFQALALASDALFYELHTNRFCHADTPDLCIVTDGAGIAISADSPGDDTPMPQWLLGLFGRDGRAAIILPMAPRGVVALLDAPRPHGPFH